MTPLKKYLLGSTTPIVHMPQIVIPIAGSVFVINTAAILITIGVSLVTSWAINALMPKPDFGDLTSRGLLVNAREPSAPQNFVYGQVRKGGTISYIEATGDKNKFLHQIIVLAGHEVEEIGDIYINDAVATLDVDGFVTDTAWDSKIRIKKFDGSQTSASSDLLSESSQITSAFVGNGIAYLYVRLEYDQNVFANGIPLITAVVKGKKVEDPRTSTTAYSNNAALCIRDYIKSTYGLSDSDIDDTYFGAAANICDEDVNLDAGGTEKRYTINGVIRADSSHQDNLSRMVTACAGTLFWGAGKWKLVPGAYTAPTKTLTLDDLRGPISLDTRANLRDQFTGVQGTFNDAAQRWITADYPPIESATFVTEDNGEERLLDLALPYTTSAATAQRIAKMTLFRGREQMTFTAEFGLNAFDVEVGEIIELDIDRYGWSGKEFEVVGWRFAPDQDSGDLRVALTLRETSSAAFSWNAEESAIIGNNTSLPDYQAALTISNLTASGGGSLQGDGTFINSAILDWDDVDNAFVSYYEVEWKPTADSTYAATTTVESGIELSPLIDGVEYTFRVRAVTNLGNKGPFATVTLTGGGDTTAPGLPTSITAEGGFEYITIRWTNPADADLNYVEVYENDSNTTSGATKVGISAGSEFVRANLGFNVTKYYFLKTVDYSGNASGFTSGVSATTDFVDSEDFTNEVISLFADQDLYLIEDVTGLPVSGDFTGQKVFNRTDGKLYEWNGSSWVLVVAAVEAPDISGQLATAQIEVGAVTSDLIATSAVIEEKLAALAVTADKVAANAITTSKIASEAITAGQLATAAVTEIKIETGAITETKIASDAITTPKIAAGAVTAGEIAAGAVTAGKIAAGSVTATEIAAGTITSNEIATNTITASNIAAGAINASELNANAVTADKIAANAVTADKINANAVTADKIASNSITSAKIVAGTIQASDIATGTITATQIASGTITGDKIFANTITGGLLATSGIITNSAQINNAVVTNAKIDNGAITTAKIGDAQITSAKIGSLEVKSANIDDLTVGTAKITGNAVSNAASNTTSAIEVSSFTRTASISTISGAQLILLLDASGRAADEAGGPEATLTVKIGATTIYTVTFDRDESGSLPVFLLYTSPSTGTVTLTVEGTASGAGATDVSFNQCAILGLKK